MLVDDGTPWHITLRGASLEEAKHVCGTSFTAHPLGRCRLFVLALIGLTSLLITLQAAATWWVGRMLMLGLIDVFRLVLVLPHPPLHTHTLVLR